MMPHRPRRTLLGTGNFVWRTPPFFGNLNLPNARRPLQQATSCPAPLPAADGHACWWILTRPHKGEPRVDVRASQTACPPIADRRSAPVSQSERRKRDRLPASSDILDCAVTEVVSTYAEGNGGGRVCSEWNVRRGASGAARAIWLLATPRGSNRRVQRHGWRCNRHLIATKLRLKPTSGRRGH